MSPTIPAPIWSTDALKKLSSPRLIGIGVLMSAATNAMMPLPSAIILSISAGINAKTGLMDASTTASTIITTIITHITHTTPTTLGTVLTIPLGIFPQTECPATSRTRGFLISTTSLALNAKK